MIARGASTRQQCPWNRPLMRAVPLITTSRSTALMNPECSRFTRLNAQIVWSPVAIPLWPDDPAVTVDLQSVFNR